MPVTIPTHKATQQSDCGILLKTISPGSFQEPVQYAHRDDYYIFGIVENGHCCISIDFKNYTVSDHEILCVQPGQVHRVVDTGNAQATILFIDSVFIDAPDKQILSEYALSVAPFRINDLQFNELEQIFSIISRNINIPESSRTKRIVQDLSRAATGIIIPTSTRIRSISVRTSTRRFPSLRSCRRRFRCCWSTARRVLPSAWRPTCRRTIFRK